MDTTIDLGFIELPQTLVEFANGLDDDERNYIMINTLPEDWEGDDNEIVVARLRSILYCNMVCKVCHVSDHYCSGCNRNPLQ